MDFPWDKNIPPSHSMLVWRFLHNKMPTDEICSLKGIPIISKCSLYMISFEISHHIFFGCPFTNNLWKWLMDKLHVDLNIQDMSDYLNLLKTKWSPQAKVVVSSCVMSIFLSDLES